VEASTFSVEVITLPVSDIERALRFYVDQAGFKLDVGYALKVELRRELDQARKVLLCERQLPEIGVAESCVGSRPYHGVGHVEGFAAESEPVALTDMNGFFHGQIYLRLSWVADIREAIRIGVEGVGSAGGVARFVVVEPLQGILVCHRPRTASRNVRVQYQVWPSHGISGAVRENPVERPVADQATQDSVVHGGSIRAAVAEGQIPNTAEGDGLRLVLVVQFVENRRVDVPVVLPVVGFERFRKCVREHPREVAFALGAQTLLKL
jgi:catechol 2,3-dioxygenase-like lactoylglutathione lyase family enzyme